MGIFGVDIYSQSRFGRDPSLTRPDFSVQPFKSLPLDYSTLFLTWALPASDNCVQIQLVRNGYNIPQDQTDGAVILNQATRAGLSYVEHDANPGFNYYTIFGCDSSSGVWVRCSDLIAILPVNWGLGDRMYNLLPAIYSDRDLVLVDPYNPWPNTPGIPPLQRFLSMLGFQLDFIRTEMESLMMVNDAQNVSGALLPLLGYQLGMPFEGEIGMQQARGLIVNAIHLYKMKGSAQGITEYASGLTGYPAALTLMGHNLLPCTDDSVAAGGSGTWQTYPPAGTGLTLAGSPYNTGLTLTPVSLTPFSPQTTTTALIGAIPTTSSAFTYANTGMAIKVTGASNVMITTGGIPTLDFLGPYKTVPNNMPNMLTANMSSLESGSLGTDWGNASSCTLVTTTAQAHAGTRSLQMTTTVATGSCFCQGPTDVARIGVTPGQTITFSAWVRAGATPEICGITLGFYAGATFLTTASVGSPTVTSSTTAWTQMIVSTIVPATATTVVMYLAMDSITASGEVHYWDDMSLTLGTPLSTISGQTPGSVTWRCQIFTPFGTPSRSVNISVAGDSGTNGPAVMVAPTGGGPTVPGSWVQYTVTAPVLPPYTVIQNPDGTINTLTNYNYLYPLIQIVGMAANEIHYYTLGMLWNEALSYPALPAYDYPRDLKIVLEPQQANMFANPLTFPTNWTHGLDGWTSLPNPAGNLLTPQQSSLEQEGIAGWATVTNVALSNSNIQSYDGLHSLQMSALATGIMSAVTTPANTVTIIGGLDYTATTWVRAQRAAANSQITLRWYDSTNTLIGTAPSVAVINATTSWTQLIVSATAPSNAAFASVLVTVVAAGAGEVHYIDLTALYVGVVSSTTATATLSIVPLTPGVVQPLSSPCATPTQLPPYGSGEMRVQPLVNSPVVWGGTVNTFSPPFSAKGWWTDPNNSWWGTAQAGYTSIQEWIDTVEGWFMFGSGGTGGYFGAGLTVLGGDWFVQPQPSTNVDCLPFLVYPAQIFTFSVYARYLAVFNLSDATMVLGFRWFFPDGTYKETASDPLDLTTGYADPPYFFRDEAPYEAVTGAPAVSVLPFIRFPTAGPQDLFGLNGAMLSPGETLNPFLDTHLHPGNLDYALDSNGASYYYKRTQIRTQRLRQTLPDWVPMSSTYSLVQGTGQSSLSLV